MNIQHYNGYTNEVTYYFATIAQNNAGLNFLWKSTTEEWIENAFDSPINSLKGYRQSCIEAVAAEIHAHYDDVFEATQKQLATWQTEQDYPEIEGFVHLMTRGYAQVDWLDIAHTYVEQVAEESTFLPQPWLATCSDGQFPLTDSGELFHD